LGCALGAGAAALIGLKDGLDFSGNISLWGFCIAGLACLVAAIHLIVERKAIDHGATPMQSMLGVSLYTVPLFLAFAVAAGEPISAPLASGSGLAALLFCFLIGVFHFGARRYCQGISQVSGFLLIELLVVIVTVVTAVVFLGEILSWTAVVGLACLPVALWIGRARGWSATP
jgi:drug/metabolite transporter (DMT)-like permease